MTPGVAVARFAADAPRRTFDDKVVQHVKLHILDTVAAIVSGSALEAGIAGQRYVAALEAKGVASILGTRSRAALVEAALANGMAAHADESDDSHEDSQTHPGCGVIPAAFVAAEERGSSGKQLIAAAVVGYEMTIRLATALGASMTFKSSSLSSHAYGPLFGAGYAAGSLMGFDEEQFRILLNYLAQEASGLTTWRLDERHTLKSYVFAGMPASNGVKAAALVRSGFTGAGDVLDRGNRNMLDAICPNPRPEALTDQLGERYAVCETDIKSYPVGYPIAAPLAALEKIISMSESGLRVATEVRVFYSEDWYKVIGDQTRMPDVNLRYCLAAAMIDGRLSFEAAHDADRMADPEIIATGARIRMLPALPHLDRFAARVEVDIAGRTIAVEQGRDVLGRVENPMSVQQVEDKATELMQPVLGKQKTQRAVEMVRNLERLADTRQLIDCLRPG